MPKVICIATRQSPLAIWQAQLVQQQLIQLYPGLQVKLLGLTTEGDRISTSLAKMGGKGLFVKELEQALLTEQADLAVHSMKDVPMMLPDGLIIGAMLARTHAGDVFVSNCATAITELAANSRVGTSSLRRQAQLRALRTDLTIEDIRGNIETRLNKMDRGEFDALILAQAGLLRLNLAHRINQLLPFEYCLPACGQGAIGIECRQEESLVELLAPLNDPITQACIFAERAMNFKLNGGCQMPIGGYAEYHAGQLTLTGLVAALDGRQILRAKAQAPLENAQQLGEKVAQALLAQGAQQILTAALNAN